MPRTVLRIRQRSCSILIFFIFLSFLKSQSQTAIIHADILSEPTGVEVTILFDRTIDRDDISGWIDRQNWFTLSLFNVSLSSPDIIKKKFNYPLLSVDVAETDGSIQIIFHTARTIDSYQLIRHAKGKNLLAVLKYSTDKTDEIQEEGELVQSFIVEELPDTFDVVKDRWRHPSSWKEARERSSIRILCDTEGLPIYVDNKLVGKSPLEFAIDVLPGWHQVGYFPTDPALTPAPRTPQEKMMDNILRMGILDVFVAEGKEQEIVLNYQSLDEDVSAYQRSISAGSWIGFSLFFLLIMLISWGVA